MANNINMNLSTAHICTVQSPRMSYQPHKVYDMETAGMISTLSEHDFLNHTIVLKLISDGPGKSSDTLTKNDIQQLIHSRKKDILTVIKNMYPALTE